MAKEEKSILEQTLLDAKKIQEALNANTKEILRSVAREEIDGIVKESLEEGYVEEDVDDTEELDLDGEETPDAPEGGFGDDIPSDDAVDVDVATPEVGVAAPEIGGDDLEGDYEGGGDEFGDEQEYDMTTATDDEVIAVYKKLTGDDEIEVVVDDVTGDVKLTVNEPGEFVIKTEEGGGEEFAGEELGGDEFGDEVAGDEFGGEELGADIGGDELGGEELGGEELGGLEAGGEEEEEYTSSEDLPGEDEKHDVMYEIALDENELSDPKLNKATKIGATASGNPRTSTSDVGTSMTGDIETGDIEGTKADADKEITGDNLKGGFDDDAVGHAKGEGQMVMAEEDEITEEEITEEEEAIEEKIQVGKGHNVTTNKTTIQGAGGKANKVKAPNVTAPNMSESNKKYNNLLKEANELKSKIGQYKDSNNKFRTMLAETVVFNTNLTYVTKLFMEHSTTRTEKEVIFERFDNEVNTMLESKKLYKTINSQLGSRKPINEVVLNKLNKEESTSKSHLNEATAYMDKESSRIMDLIKRTENR
tara:strand:+ start:29418 stop:31022 length:1605 start_codon:yes stop_codon:yes gene_type:complete